MAQGTLLNTLWETIWERNLKKNRCVCVYIYVCVCVCVCVCVYIYIYICACVANSLCCTPEMLQHYINQLYANKIFENIKNNHIAHLKKIKIPTRNKKEGYSLRTGKHGQSFPGRKIVVSGFCVLQRRGKLHDRAECRLWDLWGYQSCRLMNLQLTQNQQVSVGWMWLFLWSRVILGPAKMLCNNNSNEATIYVLLFSLLQVCQRHYFKCSEKPFRADVLKPIFKMRKLRMREIKKVLQGPLVWPGQVWALPLTFLSQILSQALAVQHRVLRFLVMAGHI